MTIDTDRVLARAEERLRDLARTPAVKQAAVKRRRRRTKSVLGRFARALIGGGSVLLAAIVYALLVGPIGVAGLLLVLFLAAVVASLLLVYPRDRYGEPGQFTETELAALPSGVEDWLEHQRKALPAPAAHQLDTILLRLDVLGPQLATLDPASPIASDARRLMGDHLPRLVETYLRVPPAYRSERTEAAQQLKQGLGVVDGELARLSQRLAEDHLNALATEGRFLESRYGEDRPLEH